MRDTDAGLLIGLTFGKMAYIGAAPGIYRFNATGTETRELETGFVAELLISQGQETEMHAT